MSANLDGESGGLAAGDVGRVANHQIEEARRIDEGSEEIGFEEGDAIGEAEAGGVVLGYGQSGGGDIGGEDLGGGEFLGEGDSNATGAGANVNEGEIFAGEFGRAAGAEFADGEAVESDFEEMFGLGAGDEDVGSDFEIEAPEFLVAGEMLCGFAGGAAADQGEIVFGRRGVEESFGVGVEPGTIAAGDVEEEEFGGESVGGDVGFAEEMDALF